MGASVHVGMPTHDGRIHQQCMMGLLEAWSQGLAGQVNVVRGSFLPRSRDLIIADFLRDERSTHLLCVDSDIEWRARDLERLLELRVDFAFGGYVGKRPGAPMQASGAIVSPIDLGVGVEAHVFERCGAGFVLLTRAAVERMVSTYAPTESYIDPLGRELVGLWQTSGRIERDDGTVVAEGEDYAFCRRWRELGGHIYTRLDVRLGHVGEHVYR